ncbi:hypothetical protein J2858_002564 [Neorhizobium galegae]|uniref:hypothetical protein n=1 Tax=Rhizobium/Agrobacterium group TaxID=227290 RepID=UPI001AE7C512|nr:hypothetical protein [Neorhizobium galegae]MBP2549641.1 hypothetical protein [Neorhizobium galegae]
MTIVQLDTDKTSSRQTSVAALSDIPIQRITRIVARIAMGVSVIVILCAWRQTGLW